MAGGDRPRHLQPAHDARFSAARAVALRKDVGALLARVVVEPVDKRGIDKSRHAALVMISAIESREEWESSGSFRGDHAAADGVDLE